MRKTISIIICITLLVVTAQGLAYKRGSYGPMVKKIQTALQQKGFYSGKIDGIYGSRTVTSIKAFQRRSGLKVDGICGEKTLAKLGIKVQTSIQASDLNLLARIISAEARGEPYVGQVAVGAVIVNRMRHPSFPNTLAGVIYQPKAFSSVNDGQFNRPVTDSAKRAARDVMNGVNPIGRAIYFYNPKTATDRWIRSRTVTKVIGSHAFCV